MGLFKTVLTEGLANVPGDVLLEGDTRWSASDLTDRVNRLASVLVTQGIQPGDRVALMFLNQKEFFVGFFAILQAGGVVVPINIQLPPDDIVYVILNSGTRLVLTNTRFAPNFQGKPIPLLVSDSSGEYPGTTLEKAMAAADLSVPMPPEGSVDDMRVLMYTSGTTGKPKGVMLSENNLLSNIEGFRTVISFEDCDKVLMALPLFHAYGLIVALAAMAAGARLILVPQFSPKAIVSAITTEQATILPLVPTFYTVLLSHAQKYGAEAFRSLRLCVSGGASLPLALLKTVENLLNVMVLEGYGLTETSPVVSVNCPKRGSIPGSVGKPLPNVLVKLVDDQGTEIVWLPGAESAVGEIWVKGPSVMRGYYQLPEETAEVLDESGWFRTGDLGHFDAEGHLYISGGRKKDLIIKAGENIAPLRIEQVLYQHPAVQEASVIGVPDPKLGEEILACVQLKPDVEISEAAIKQYCGEHLSPFYVPRRFRFYTELPKNPTGKIMKNVLRDENRDVLVS